MNIKTIIVIVALIINFGFMYHFKDQANTEAKQVQALTLQLSQEQSAAKQCSDSVVTLKAAADKKAEEQKVIQQQAAEVAKTFTQKAQIIMETPAKTDDYCKEADDLVNKFIDDRDSK